MKATHTFGPIYDEKSIILILGSFPSVKSREISFYYGHPQNRFWKIMENIYQTSFHSIEEKKQFLHEHHIALWDVIQSCEIQGSSDASITNIEVNDIASLLQNTNILKILVNGKKAEELYQKYLYPKTHIPCISLPSTSPANAAYSLERLIDIWEKELI